MDFFTHRNGELMAEDLAIAEIARKVGTPFYCYSAGTLQRHARIFREAVGKQARVCFAVKANSNLAVLKLLAKEGLGADVVSEGEIRRALAAGISPERIVFSGVGKSRAEMRYALSQGIFQFNVESEAELDALNDIAIAMMTTAPVALRINPDVDAKTHAKISTGKKENKFGIAFAQAPALFRKAARLPGISLQGVSVHIGSQLTSLAPFRTAYTRVRKLVEALAKEGIALATIDLGGGLGVPYNAKGAPPLPKEYGALVRSIFGGMEAQLIFEPGRLIAANAGILVTQVISVKKAARTYVVIDAGMNDLLRPALYDAKHDVVAVKKSRARAVTFDLVGPVCESSDVFMRNLSMPLPQEGDLLVLRGAGAYGATMANSYNSRLLVPEVLVDGNRFAVVRERPSYEAMLGQDSIPRWL